MTALFFSVKKWTALHISRFSASANLFALSLALISQYGFGFTPCILCLWQRVPVVLVITLGLIAEKWPHKARLLVGVMAAAMLGNAGLAFYHSGVEWLWWAGTSACSTPALPPVTDAESLRLILLNTPVTNCAKPALVIAGITMANANTLFSAALSLLCLCFLKGGRH